MKMKYSAARPGSGKTYEFTRRMGETPGRYVFVVDRVDMIPQRRREILDAADRAGNHVHILARHAKRASGDNRFAVDGVRQQLEIDGKDCRDYPHVVVICTHEGLKQTNWSNYQGGGWTIIIDEVPQVLDHDTPCTSANVEFFRRNYNLEPVERQWSRVILRKDAVPLEAVKSDDQMSSWTLFHGRLLAGQTVLVNLQQWDDMIPTNKRWEWYTLWDPTELAHFDDIYLLGNSFEHSMTCKVWKREFPHIEFERFEIPPRGEWKPRSMRLQYFTEDHVGSTTFWTGQNAKISSKADPDQGPRCLRAVVDWIAANSDPENHIFTCNSDIEGVVRNAGVPGTFLTPKQHGSNEFANKTTASAIYSSKCGPFERHIFTHFDISKEEVDRSRQIEDLIQFATRLSIRVPDDVREVVVRVYDRETADALAEFFSATGYVKPVLELIDVGITHEQRPKGGREAEQLTPEEEAEKKRRYNESAAERQRRRRAKLREEAAASGEVVRPRGRPKGSKNKPKAA